MHLIKLTGHIDKPAEVKDLGTTQVINFTVTVLVTTNKKEFKIWYQCAYFTNDVSVAPWLTTGSHLSIVGTPRADAYIGTDGKPKASLKCNVNKITMHSSTYQPAAATT